MKSHRLSCKPFRIALLALLALAHSASAIELRGRAVDPAGSPAAGAPVWLYSPHAAAATHCDADGRFAFDGLAPDVYGLAVRSDAAALGLWEGRVHGDKSVEIALASEETITLHTLGPAREPIAGVYLKSLRVSGMGEVPLDRLYTLGYPQVRSGEDGQLVVDRLPAASSVELVLAHRAYAAFHVPGLPTGTEFTANMSSGVRVSGRVTGAEGKGVSGARVVVFSEAGGKPVRIDEAQSDPEGFYVMRVPVVSEAFITAAAPGYPASLPQSLPLGGTDEARALIAMERAGEAQGRVVDESGEPVGGTDVYYRRRSQIVARAITGTDGTFRFALAPGEGTVGVMPRPGFFVKGDPEQTIVGGEAATPALTPFALRPLPAVEGQVLSAEDAPVANALVRCAGLPGDACAVTDAAGGFRILLRAAPAGASITVLAEDATAFQRAQGEFMLDAPEPLRLRMAPFQPNVDPPAGLAPVQTELLGSRAPAWRVDAWNTIAGGDSAPSLESLSGNVVVLTFWTSAEPDHRNRGRLALMNALHAMQLPGVAVVAIHEGGIAQDAAKQATESERLAFPVAVDSALGDTFRGYGVMAVPLTVLVDKAGRLRYYGEDAHLLERVKALLREP